jgi:hypothetical protein
MQSPCAHNSPSYTAQALRARGKRAVALTHAFGLRSIVAGGPGVRLARHRRRRQELRRQRCTARRFGGCEKHCDDNDAQPGRLSHGRRGRDVRYACTIINAHHISDACMQLPCARDYQPLPGGSASRLSGFICCAYQAPAKHASKMPRPRTQP